MRALASVIRSAALIFFAAAMLLNPAMGETVSARDDRGRVVTLLAPATRIVSLAPHTTELLFEAGAGDKVIGVSLFSDYPEAAKKIPSIGDAAHADLERIVALQPDLVVAWKTGNHAKDLEALERL